MFYYLNVSVWLAASPIFSSGSDPDSPLSEQSHTRHDRRDSPPALIKVVLLS
jgi:hypothetical protein